MTDFSAVFDLTFDGAYRSVFNFPDGQPHVAVSPPGRAGYPLRLAARVSSSDDLVRLLAAQDAIQRRGWRPVDLTLGYVMGGRMDRAMPDDGEGRSQPFTLKVVADCIRTAGFRSISVFDPHSDVTPALLDAATVLPVRQVRQALAQLPGDTVLVAPDAGAAKRVATIAGEVKRPWVQAIKKRDPLTGGLSGFAMADSQEGAAPPTGPCLIVDDICDGGRTFTGVSEVLRARGYTEVHLYVSHGVFSGPTGAHLPGIDRVFTTSAYQDLRTRHPDLEVLPWWLP